MPVAHLEAIDRANRGKKLHLKTEIKESARKNF